MERYEIETAGQHRPYDIRSISRGTISILFIIADI